VITSFKMIVTQIARGRV